MHKATQRFRSAGAAIMSAGLLLVGWGGVAGAADPAKEVVFAQGIDTIGLDPVRDSSITAFNVHNQMFDRLLERDKSLQLVGHLLTEWKLVEPTTWDVKLRPGVKFHNGEPFDAESVKFSIERIVDPNMKSPKRPWLSSIKSVTVIDPLTARILTSSPDPALPARLTLVHAVPARYIKEKGDDHFAQNPIGTGPYRLVRYVRGDYTELAANPGYWLGAPKIAKARIRIIPETSARVAALQAGEVHVIANLPPDDVARMPKDRVQAQAVPSIRIIFAGLVNTKGGPLDKKAVRQAINYAVDKKSLVDAVLQGYGIENGNPVPNMVLGYNQNVKPYPYDPAKAKQLLAESGFPGGFEITMGSPSGRYLKDTEVVQAIVGQLGQVGIKVKLQVREWSAYMRSMGEKTSDPMYLLGWGAPALDPDTWITPTLENGQYYTSGYRLPDPINRLIGVARSEVDGNKRRALYHELAQALSDEAPRLFLYQQKDIYGVSTQLDWLARSDELVFFAAMAWK